MQFDIFYLIFYIVGDILGTFGTVFSVSGPTLAKKLLKLLVISTGSSTIFPFTFSCPDELENMCYAEFATSYINKNVKEIPEDETIGTYTTPVNVGEEKLASSNKTITLKNDLGKMKK